MLEIQKQFRNICIVHQMKGNIRTFISAFGSKQKVYEFLTKTGVPYLVKENSQTPIMGKVIGSYQSFCLKLRSAGKITVTVATMGELKGTFEVTITVLE